jgi:hypothetical protein
LLFSAIQNQAAVVIVADWPSLEEVARLFGNSALHGELTMNGEERLPKDEQIDGKMLDEREANLLNDIRETRHYYSKSAREARLFHSVITIIVLFGSVVAPIAVVSSTGTHAGLALFGIDEKLIAQIAVIVTVILSLCEGLRRSFQFDMRWMTCVQAREQLRQLCDFYLDRKVEFARDDAERHKRLEELRQKTYEIRAQEESGFFKRLTARMEGERRQ